MKPKLSVFLSRIFFERTHSKSSSFSCNGLAVASIFSSNLLDGLTKFVSYLVEVIDPKSLKL